MVLLALLFFLRPEQARSLVNGIFGPSGGGTLHMATASRSGAYYQLGDALRSELLAKSGYTLELLETEGSIANLELLHQGKCDVGLIQSGLSADLSGLTALAKVDRQYTHLIVPKDSPIKTFRDLSGKRVGLGARNSGFANLGERLFSFYHFTPAPELVYDHRTNLEEAFLDGDIDAAFTVYGLFTPAIEELLDSGWYTLLPITEAAALERYIPGTFAETLPHGLYGPERDIPADGDAPFMTLAVDTLLVARNEADALAVTTLLTGLYEAPYPREARLNSVSEAEGQRIHSLPLHPAVKKFYSRNAPLTADHFEIASFFLAGMLFLASLTHYFIERRKRSHLEKQRKAIIPYFEELLAYEQRLEGAEDPGAIMALTQEMMAKQHEAEAQWLKGKLSTEHMENLYAVYNIRVRNAFSKITNLQLQRMGGAAPAVESVSEKEFLRRSLQEETPWPPTPDEVQLETPEEAVEESAPELVEEESDFEPEIPERNIGRHPLVSQPVTDTEEEEMVSITDMEGIGKVRIRRKPKAAPEVSDEEVSVEIESAHEVLDAPSEEPVSSEEEDEGKEKPQLDLCGE